MGAVPLPWAFVTAAASDDCCSRLSVVVLSAAVAWDGTPAERRAEDKQPNAPITNTLVGVFIIFPPGESQTVDEQPSCHAQNERDSQKPLSRAILPGIEWGIAARYFSLCKMEHWLQEKTFDASLFRDIVS
jgi:hypothetical protein